MQTIHYPERCCFVLFSTMLFQFGFYSSLLLVFFVHGLVYSVLLLRKGMVVDRTLHSPMDEV